MDNRELGSHARGVYCVSHIGYLEPRNSKGKTRGRNRHMNHSKIVKNMKEREQLKGESPIQGLTSAKDLTIELPEGHESANL